MVLSLSMNINYIPIEMKKLLIILFFGISTVAYAQKDTLYLDADWDEVSKEYAEYYRPLPLEKKGNMWLIKDYHMTGVLQFVGHTTDEYKEILHGDVIWYFPDKKIQQKSKYENGVPIGYYYALESTNPRMGKGYDEDELHYMKVDFMEGALDAEDAVESAADAARDTIDEPEVYSAADFPLLKEGLPPITFIQNGKRQELLKPYQSITLEKEPFTITFPGMAVEEAAEKYHPTQMTLVTDRDSMRNISVGMMSEDTVPFAPATGMAMDYDAHYLIISADAHNYLFYNEAGNSRLELSKKIEGDVLLLKYTVDALFFNGTEYSMQDFPHDDFPLYLIIFIDKNENERIEKGELNKVEIRFE